MHSIKNKFFRKFKNLIELNNSHSKMRTLLMVLYEGALRKGELLNFKY